MADEGGASHLDQFLILAKNARGKAAIALIQQALNHKKTFVFGELLETENIQGVSWRGPRFSSFAAPPKWLTPRLPCLKLKGSEDHALLALFAYGTYPEYKGTQACRGHERLVRCAHAVCTFLPHPASKASLPELSPKQLKKLKQLTIVSLAQKQKVVPYTTLQESLDITNLRELEDLVIESIYAVSK